MRIIFLSLLFVLTLYGRDNPFVSSNEKQMPTTNKVEVLTPFIKEEIKLPDSARAVKAITIRYQNLDGSISNKELPLNSSVDWHSPLIITQEKSLAKNKKNTMVDTKKVGYKFIYFNVHEKNLNIETKDKMLRNFILSSPNRIVIDFARDTSFKPKKFSLNNAPFKSIRMGNHDKYYRVVITLDGQYETRLMTTSKGHTVVYK